jgi:hypothetical protein
VGTTGIEPVSQAFQARAKTTSATSPLVVPEGIEPPTPASSARRSTDELRYQTHVYNSPEGLVNKSGWDVSFIKART